MKKPELIIPCRCGYYTKSKLFAYVDADTPCMKVTGVSEAEIKSKLRNRIQKLKLPYMLKLKWKLI